VDPVLGSTRNPESAMVRVDPTDEPYIAPGVPAAVAEPLDSWEREDEEVVELEWHSDGVPRPAASMDAIVAVRPPRPTLAGVRA
jgi:hypothetical protein